MYRPLPNYLTIKDSEIEGLGLFATDHIPVKTRIGISHYNILGNLIRTPLGGFYNHSDNPNCFKLKQENFVGGDIIWWELYTARSIGPGEEITVSYDFYNIE